MKYRIVIFTLILVLSQLSFAQTSQPEACPSLDVMKAVKFQEAVNTSDGWKFKIKRHFSTPQEWLFIVYSTGKNEQEATQQAYLNLGLIHVVKGPMHLGKASICVYYSDEIANFPTAVTPPIDF